MNAHMTKIILLFIAVAALAATVSCAAQSIQPQAQQAQPRQIQPSSSESSSKQRISLWGSSVAMGIGDETKLGGYAGHVQTLLVPRGFELINQSKGGDNTVTITPRFEPGEAPEEKTGYLLSANPDYVIIGLSLGNEGIAQCQLGQTNRCTNTLEQADAVFNQFAAGLQRLIARARAADIIPVITLPYARSDFWEREYGLTRRMNLLINAWDVPSVNTLGAVDDGQGRWARGLWADPFHPNAAGHQEIALSFVPSLFAALQAGKPTPQRVPGSGFVRVRSDTRNSLTYTVNDPMHSFALTFRVRPPKSGPIADIRGQTLNSDYSMVRRTYGEFEWDTESLELTPAGRFAASLSVADGRITYVSSTGNSLSTPLTLSGSWHDVTLTHYTGRGETLLYVDGEHVGSINERLQPDTFSLGGTAATDYQDWMIHRAALNHDEVRALHSNELLQASLEIYVPLKGKDRTANRAQSLSEVQIDGAAVQFDPAPIN